jgi:D-serine deaminase-like pyridoxal phosphate-dependent protein
LSDWFHLSNADEVASPALLLFPDRIHENIRRMINMAGAGTASSPSREPSRSGKDEAVLAPGATRLRPHIKTHKLAEIVRMQIAEGITKVKCATIAEAEMAARAGASDIFIGYPMIGPNAKRLLELVKAFPEARFSCLADDLAALRDLSQTFGPSGHTVEALLDLDCGQHRTGSEPGPKAAEVYRAFASSPGIKPGGLHAYDGHITDEDLRLRTVLCDKAFARVTAFRDQLLAAGLSVPRVVAGGTPTFPIHARRNSVECSPGTCVLWDFGYDEKFSDLKFLIAALVLTRVVSKPGSNRLCLDLGHKAIASENPFPRVKFLNLPDAKQISHSEEHLVVETARACEFRVGDCFFGVPRHICPTVALYSEATVVRDGRASEVWRITARERRLRF